MSKVMTPAISLMNRLTYNRKFTLISVLWLLPILALTYLLVTQINHSINQVQHELDGIERQQAILEILNEARAYQAYQAIARQRTVPKLSNMAREKANNINQLLEKFVPRINESDSIDKALKEQVITSNNAWQALQRNNHQAADVFSQYRYYQEFSNKLNSLVASNAQLSGLNQDAQSEVNALLVLNNTFLFNALETLAYARAVGSYALNESAINYVISDALNELFDELSLVDEKLKTAISHTLSVSPVLEQGFGKKITVISNSIPLILQSIDEDIINPVHLEKPWSRYEAEVSREMAKFETLQQQILETISDILQQRFNQESSSRTTLFIILGLVLSIIVYLYMGFSIAVKKSIKGFSQAARQVSAGDLTVILEQQSQDELGQLSTEFNAMTSQMRQLIEAVRSTTGSVASQSDKVEQAAHANRDAISRQMSETSQISNAIQDMVRTVEAVANDAEQTSAAANHAEDQAKEGQAVVDETLKAINLLAQEISHSVENINRVSKDSDEINQVLIEIKAIAEQTNLLALNAAIEAARAGDQGRGFAVVADEVRTLSQRTQRSTEEIETMIERLQRGVAGAVTAMDASQTTTATTVEQSQKVALALSKIVDSVDSIVNMSQQIASAAEEQSAVAKTIESNVNQIVTLGEETEDNANTALSSSTELAENTSSLSTLIGAFKS